MKIYGSDFSTPSNRVRMIANAIGVDYEYVRVNLREGEYRTEEYKKHHPAGKIPALEEDDGFQLFESGAIIRYLAEKNASPLYPEDARARAIVNQWDDFAVQHISVNVGRLLWNKVFYKFVGDQKDERSLQDGEKFLNRFLPVVENRLAENEYLAGVDMSLADITLLAGLDPSEAIDLDLSVYPKISAWRERLRARDFYQECHQGYEEMLMRMAGN